MKIAIFGGSFNPVHKGHLAVAKQAIKELELDKLFFVPAYKSPFKTKIKYVDAEHRINMLKLCLPEKAEVSEFETNRKSTSYTIDTVRYFRQKFPDAEIFLLIGSDNVYKLNKWKQINEIAEKVKITVFRRKGEFSKINIKRYNCVLMNNEIYDYASSDFRNGILSNVEDEVIKYISKNYLYIPDLMVNMLDAQRHKHSISVGSYAAQYAKVVGIDPKKAWATGCLHDITKSWPKAKHREYLRTKGIDDNLIQDFELHSLTGYYWIRDEYKLDDEEVINAVLRHTSLAPELSKMDKIIFAADKLCDGRRHQGIQKDRELILSNFDKGFKKIVNVVYKILMDMDRPLSKEQKEIYRKWGE